MKKILLSILIIGSAVGAEAKIKIITTTQDLAAIASEVGGDFAEAESIAKGYQDTHFVEAKPSYYLKLKKADLFIQIGLEHEIAWAPQLVINARNPKILPGQAGFLDAHEGIEIAQKPSGTVDRTMGDVHPHGNPHYWLDPANGEIIARNIADRLAQIDPSNKDAYNANFKRFEEKLKTKIGEWQKIAVPLKDLPVVTYHDSWPYFAKRFGLNIRNFIEPRPGVPPSPSHLQSLIQQVKSEKIPLLIVEPYYDERLPEKIAKETGSSFVVVPHSVGAIPEIKTYFDLFDYNLKVLTQTLAQRGGR